MRRGQRLRRPEQFQRVRRTGTSWTHPLFILNAARNRVGHTRCGFIVGKQFGKAHDRNRAKRRAREAVRLLYGNIAPGYDLVFVVRPPAADASFPELQQAIIELLQRADLWQSSVTSKGQQETSHEPDRSDIDSILPTLYLTSSSS
jgi:ribonuclease P protein component